MFLFGQTEESKEEDLNMFAFILHHNRTRAKAL